MAEDANSSLREKLNGSSGPDDDKAKPKAKASKANGAPKVKAPRKKKETKVRTTLP